MSFGFSSLASDRRLPTGRSLSALGLTFSLMLFLAACGGNNPDVDGGNVGGGDDGEDTSNDAGITDTRDDPQDPDTGPSPDSNNTDDTGPTSDVDRDTEAAPDGGCPPDACQIGNTRCTEEDKLQSCKAATGCGRWSSATECEGDQVCNSGSCTEPNPCNADNLRCSSNATCMPDSSGEDGYVCQCNSAFDDYLGDGTVCYNSERHKVVEPGTFQMGSPSGETGRDTDETRHQVSITRTFLMSRSEVQRANWGAVVSNTPPSDKCEFGTCPINHVSWWAALKYANEFSERQQLETCYELQNCSGTPGRDFSCSSVDFKGLSCEGWRLPTEAEWEFAARAGTTTATYNGDISNPGTDSTVDAIAWYRSNSNGEPRSSGRKQANDNDLVDTSGNVAEWVWDRYASYPSGQQTDPTGPTSGDQRVVRGGHWDSTAASCRSAARAKQTPDTRNRKIGFRVVRTIPGN